MASVIKTTVVVGGHKFELEAFDSTSHDELERMFKVMSYVAGKSEKPANAAAKPMGKAPEQKEHAREYEEFLAGKVIVSGTIDAPRVDIYDSNPNLKFPVIKVPMSIFPNVFDGDPDPFKTVGTEHNVSWMVTWKRSAKNPKYKDIVSIEEVA